MSSDFLDYYVLLGIHPTAIIPEINTAYRYAALLHPDKALPEFKTAATAAFIPYRDAKEVLSEPKQRKHYDAI
jgi:DnaJ-class molecular chaperone